MLIWIDAASLPSPPGPPHEPAVDRSDHPPCPLFSWKWGSPTLEAFAQPWTYVEFPAATFPWYGATQVVEFGDAPTVVLGRRSNTTTAALLAAAPQRRSLSMDGAREGRRVKGRGPANSVFLSGPISSIDARSPSRCPKTNRYLGSPQPARHTNAAFRAIRESFALAIRAVPRSGVSPFRQSIGAPGRRENLPPARDGPNRPSPLSSTSGAWGSFSGRSGPGWGDPKPSTVRRDGARGPRRQSPLGGQSRPSALFLLALLALLRLCHFCAGPGRRPERNRRKELDAIRSSVARATTERAAESSATSASRLYFLEGPRAFTVRISPRTRTGGLRKKNSIRSPLRPGVGGYLGDPRTGK